MNARVHRRGRGRIYKFRHADRPPYVWVGVKPSGVFGVFKSWREAAVYVMGSHVGFLAIPPTLPWQYTLGNSVYGCGCGTCEP